MECRIQTPATTHPIAIISVLLAARIYRLAILPIAVPRTSAVGLKIRDDRSSGLPARWPQLPIISLKSADFTTASKRIDGIWNFIVAKPLSSHCASGDAPLCSAISNYRLGVRL